MSVSLAGCLVGWSNGWMVGWLVGWLVSREGESLLLPPPRPPPVCAVRLNPSTRLDRGRIVEKHFLDRGTTIMGVTGEWRWAIKSILERFSMEKQTLLRRSSFLSEKVRVSGLDQLLLSWLRETLGP